MIYLALAPYNTRESGSFETYSPAPSLPRQFRLAGRYFLGSARIPWKVHAGVDILPIKFAHLGN